MLKLRVLTKLLVAAFFASYNPARFDVRYFAKNEAHARKKGGGARKQKADALGMIVRLF